MIIDADAHVEESEVKGSNLFLANSSDSAHPIPKLCIRLHPRRDSMTCPTHRSIAPHPKPLRYLL